MTRYAERTKVPIPQSKAEIERTVKRYGADGFLSGEAEGMAVIMFRAQGRHVKFVVPMPADDDREGRRRWRCLLLVIKSKLESVETGIVTFDEAFMPHIVLPDGKTIGQHMAPQIEAAYETGNMPPLLPYHGGAP